jgi:hypothetical protein
MSTNIVRRRRQVVRLEGMGGLCVAERMRVSPSRAGLDAMGGYWLCNTVTYEAIFSLSLFQTPPVLGLILKPKT